MSLQRESAFTEQPFELLTCGSLTFCFGVVDHGLAIDLKNNILAMSYCNQLEEELLQILLVFVLKHLV